MRSVSRRKEQLAPVGRWGEREAGILEVAAELFRRRGYQNVTMADVAAEAGLSEGTLYNYFRDRHDLVLRVSLDAFEEHAVKAERIAQEAQSLHEGVAGMIALQMSILLDAKEIYRIWMREVRGAEDYGKLPARAMLRRYSTPMIHLLKKWLAPRDIPPGMDFGMMRDLIFGGVENFVQTAVLQERDRELDVAKLSWDIAGAYLRAFGGKLEARTKTLATPRAKTAQRKRARSG